MATSSRTDALAVRCPNCGALPTKLCFGASRGLRVSCHRERHQAATTRRPREARLGIKKIEEHTNGELTVAIERAVTVFPLFWIIMHGVDAYLERRKRREARRNTRDMKLCREDDDREASYGSS